MENVEQVLDQSSVTASSDTSTTETPMQETAPASETPTGETSPASEAPAEEVAEKMVPQSQVNKIVAREKRLEREKAMREVQSQMERQQLAQTPPANLEPLGQMTHADLQRHIQKAAYDMSQRAVVDRIASEFQSKISTAVEADPEFADAFGKLNIENHGELVLWTNSLDNTAEVLKDLAKNPAKLSNVLMLAKSGFNDLAQEELKKLSTSIKMNEAAKKQPKAPEPLNQLKPSMVAGNSGEMSVSDFRKKFSRR